MGTGIGVIQDDGDIGVVKSHLSSLDFVRGEMFEWAESRMHNSCALLGHTRYPTFQNTVTDKYAQPYMFKDSKDERAVILTHNGHLNNYHNLTSKIDHFNYSVDSAHLARAMAEYGSDPLTFLPKVKGGYALVWYDEDTDQIHIANNGGREMFLAFDKTGTKAYYASTENSLSFLTYQCAADIKEIKNVPSMMLCSFDLGKDKLDPGVYKTYKEEVFVPVPVQRSESGTTTIIRASGGPGGADSSKKGRRIWVQITSADFTPYRDKEGTESLYGYVWGTISTDVGSLVRVNGLRRADWEHGDLKLISKCCPCIQSTCEAEDDAGGDKFNYYNAIIDANGVKDEIARQKGISARRDEYTVRKVVEGLVDGPNSTQLTRSDWDVIAGEGCFECNKTIIPSDIGKVGWQLIQTKLSGSDLYQMVCPPCVEQIVAGKRESKAL